MIVYYCNKIKQLEGMNVWNICFEDQSSDVQIMLVCKKIESKLDVVFAHISSKLHTIISWLEVVEKNIESSNNTVETIGVKVDELNMNINAIKDQNKKIEDVTRILKKKITKILLDVKNRCVEENYDFSNKGEEVGRSHTLQQKSKTNLFSITVEIESWLFMIITLIINTRLLSLPMWLNFAFISCSNIHVRRHLVYITTWN